MNNTDQFFVDVMKNHLCGTKNVENDFSFNEERFKELANIHRVVGICYSQIKDMEIEQKYLQYFEIGFYSELNRFQKRNVVLQKLKKLFNDNGIEHICIKGSYVADLYPVPELRTMSDLDILIKKESVELAHKILMDNGSKYIQKHSDEDVRMYRYLDVTLEIHSDLVSKDEEVNDVDFKAYFSDVFEHTVRLEDSTFILEEEYNLVYTMFHIAKHFYNSGCGIRMLMDLPVIIKNSSKISWKNVWNELNKLKLEEFTVKIFMICEKWFGKFDISYPEKYRFSDMEIIEDFILAGGVYGFHGRNVDAYQIKRKGKKKEGKYNYVAGMIRWAFPTYSEMRQFSNWYREKPAILLPVAYIERFYRNVKERGGIVTLIKNIISGKKDISEKQMILGIMNLK